MGVCKPIYYILLLRGPTLQGVLPRKMGVSPSPYITNLKWILYDMCTYILYIYTHKHLSNTRNKGQSHPVCHLHRSSVLLLPGFHHPIAGGATGAHCRCRLSTVQLLPVLWRCRGGDLHFSKLRG